MLHNLFNRDMQAFGVFVDVFSRPVRDIAKTSLVHDMHELSAGNVKDFHIYELVDNCRVRVKPLFFPLSIPESDQKGFLITGQVTDYFGVLSLHSETLGEFCDRWGDNLEKIYGAKTCGYKPSYPDPRSMLLDKFVEAEKNNELLWHE